MMIFCSHMKLRIWKFITPGKAEKGSYSEFSGAMMP